MKVACLAEAHYIDLMPHNPLGPICTAASIHLAAACPNFSWLEEVNTEIEPLGTNCREVLSPATGTGWDSLPRTGSARPRRGVQRRLGPGSDF